MFMLISWNFFQADDSLAIKWHSSQGAPRFLGNQMFWKLSPPDSPVSLERPPGFLCISLMELLSWWECWCSPQTFLCWCIASQRKHLLQCICKKKKKSATNHNLRILTGTTECRNSKTSKLLQVSLTKKKGAATSLLILMNSEKYMNKIHFHWSFLIINKG